MGWSGRATQRLQRTRSHRRGGLSPLEADPEENILPRIKELGGSATTSVTTAAARSNQIINELIDGDYKTGWRVYTNPNGAELNVDMGAIFVLHRIRLLRGVLNDDERSLRGYEFYVNDGDSLNFIGGNPVYALIAQDRSHGLPRIGLELSRRRRCAFFGCAARANAASRWATSKFLALALRPLPSSYHK